MKRLTSALFGLLCLGLISVAMPGLTLAGNTNTTPCLATWNISWTGYTHTSGEYHIGDSVDYAVEDCVGDSITVTFSTPSGTTTLFSGTGGDVLVAPGTRTIFDSVGRSRVRIPAVLHARRWGRRR